MNTFGFSFGAIFDVTVEALVTPHAGVVAARRRPAQSVNPVTALAAALAAGKVLARCR